ncbi:MAG: polyphenol oxidase [Sphingomonadales bacterium BRH_c42]|nr:MAG: polyphenol oxidase [Sphingomonadales bacterium BRH_c42]
MAEPVRSALLEDIPHGFFGRQGGVSQGLVAGLQCGFGAEADIDAVRTNRRIATESVLPGGVLVTPYQTHSADVMTVIEPWDERDRPNADALVTDRKGIVLGIVTADCAPVLLADQAAGVIGAAHAGWRGAHGSILENTVTAMEALGAAPGAMAAVIGPTIQQASYEVDDAFRARFDEADLGHFMSGRPGHWQFDLPGYVAARLVRAGVGRVESVGLDTYALEDRYFSFRRATHRREYGYGRQISLIALA